MTKIENFYNSPGRLEALRDLEILDTEAESDFDEIVELASKIFNKPISLISLVDLQRQWFKAKIGLDDNETPVDIAFCKHAIEQNNVFVVEDATKDDRFRNNPLVVGSPDIRFYAGTQLQTSEGYNVGTLCVLDNKPGQITVAQHDALIILGKQVVKQFELRKAIRNLSESKRKIEEQQQALKELLGFKDKVFAVVGHDLQGPINGLAQVMELLNSGALSDEEFKGLMPVLTDQVKSAGDILDNLLAWAKSQRSGLNVQLTPVCVTDVFAEVIGMLSTDASKKNIEISVNASNDIPVVSLNKEAITIVLRNLVKNSIKFCNPNDKITLSCSIENTTLTFAVKDTGIGFDETIAGKLFNTAEHVTTYGTAREKGTGLGLLICKNLVEHNGGTIWAEGKPNEGASFYFTTPV